MKGQNLTSVEFQQTKKHLEILKTKVFLIFFVKVLLFFISFK